MIVHRFMSNKEYQRLLAGETLTNTMIHADNGRKSSSVGFCFFTESPEDAIHWLSFIVNTDWCITFDIPELLLTKSRARYRDPEKDRWDAPATIYRTEWCLKEYSIQIAHIVKADNQYAMYAENIKKELANKLGLIGQLLLMTI